MLDITQSSDFKRIGDRVGYEQFYDIDVQIKRNEMTGPEALDQSIENLIMTEKGERLFNTDFGSPMHDVLFENNTNVDELRSYIYDEIEKWIPIKINRGYETMRVNDSTHILEVWFRYSSTDGSVVNHDFKRKFSL